MSLIATPNVDFVDGMRVDVGVNCLSRFGANDIESASSDASAYRRSEIDDDPIHGIERSELGNQHIENIDIVRPCHG